MFWFNEDFLFFQIICCNCYVGMRWWICVKIRIAGFRGGRRWEKLRPNSIMTHAILAIRTNIAIAMHEHEHAHHAHDTHTHSCRPLFTIIRLYIYFSKMNIALSVSSIIPIWVSAVFLYGVWFVVFFFIFRNHCYKRYMVAIADRLLLVFFLLICSFVSFVCFHFHSQCAWETKRILHISVLAMMMLLFSLSLNSFFHES